MTSFRPPTRVASARIARGFTLIELMIVVAVVAILAAIAYPSYQDAIRKSKRGQVKADLVELAQRYERYYTTENKYTDFWSKVATADKVSPRGATGGAIAYAITSAEAGNTFTLTATPQNRQTSDTRCNVLTLNQAGVKTKNGSGSLSDCW